MTTLTDAEGDPFDGPYQTSRIWSIWHRQAKN